MLTRGSLVCFILPMVSTYNNTLPIMQWAVVVAQLVERSLPVAEVHGSNPDIGQNYNEHLFIGNCIERTK